jgi:hypothetical protein
MVIGRVTGRAEAVRVCIASAIFGERCRQITLQSEGVILELEPFLMSKNDKERLSGTVIADPG